MKTLIGDIHKRDCSNFHPEEASPPLIQYHWEFQKLLNILWKKRPINILEIGSERGGSLYQFMQLGIYEKRKIASIDFPSGLYNVNYDEWKTWAREGIDFKLILDNSHLESTYKELVEFMPEIDFLFIDGDHTYGGAKSDFMMYGPLIRDGGIIALHDIQPHSKLGGSEVHKLWKEIRECGYITRELLSMPNQDERGIGIVYC